VFACATSIGLLVTLNKPQKKAPVSVPTQIPPNPTYIDASINKNILYKLITENLNLIELYQKKYETVKVNYRKAYYESLNTTAIQEWTPKLQIVSLICYVLFIGIFIYKNTDSWMKKLMIILSIYVITNVYVLKFIILFIIYLYNILSVKYLYNINK
jgi:hypothetical protein